MQPTQTDEKDRDFDFDRLFEATRKLRGEKAGPEQLSTPAGDEGDSVTNTPRKSWRRGGFVLAIAALGAFYALNPWTQKTAPGEVPTLHADVTPLKSKPTDPGGEAVPFQDQTVFNRLNAPDSKTSEAGNPAPETVLPQAEEPVLATQKPQASPPVASSGTEQLALKPSAQPAVSAGESQAVVAPSPAKLESIDEPLLPPAGSPVATVPAKAPAAASSASTQSYPQAQSQEASPSQASSPRSVISAKAAQAIPKAKPLTTVKNPQPDVKPQTVAVVASPAMLAPVPQTDLSSSPTVEDELPATGKNADVPQMTSPAKNRSSHGAVTQKPQQTAQTDASVQNQGSDSIGKIITNLDTDHAPAAPPAPPPAVAVKPAAAVKSSVSAPVPAGFVRIQLASIPNEATAQGEAARMIRQYGNVLNGTALTPVKADLGAKGVYWRIQTPAMSREDAASLCKSLKSAGAACILVHP